MTRSEQKITRINLAAIKTSREVVDKVFAPYNLECPNAELIAKLESANFTGICYHCGGLFPAYASKDIKGRNRFICNNCGRYFIEELTYQVCQRLKNVKYVFDIHKSENPNEALMTALKNADFKEICYYCGSKDFLVRKHGENRKERYQCKICKRTFTEGLAHQAYKHLSKLEACPRCGGFNSAKGGHCSNTGRQVFKCKDCERYFVEGANDPNQRNNRHYKLPISEDVWDAKSLGLRVNKHETNSKLVFEHIHQGWLKDAVKKFIRYSATARQYSTLLGYLGIFNWLSNFLKKNYPAIDFNGIDRPLILDLISELNKHGYSSNHKSRALCTVNTFFEIGIINNWFYVQPYLIVKEDYPKGFKGKPRFIPEEVMQQLNKHLDSLPEPVMRMVLVIQECGMRVGELLQLRFDCLKQDAKGGWFLHFTRWKMLKEDTIPISAELASAIREQQEFIRNQLGNDFEYLFCARKNGRNFKWTDEFSCSHEVMEPGSFSKYLKNLFVKFDIKDTLGQCWNFQTHQFRHTVGTRMINNGVPQHIVQRYLGHESPGMTSVYARIHDETLKKQIEQFHAKVVNIAGEFIESESPELDNNTDLQWLRRKVLAEVLPNGYCGLPISQTCSKGNACLTCGDFRTTSEFIDQHKEHLKRTQEVLEIAKANAWQRQIQVNQDVKNSLENIINTLDSNQDE